MCPRVVWNSSLDCALGYFVQKLSWSAWIGLVSVVEVSPNVPKDYVVHL